MRTNKPPDGQKRRASCPLSWTKSPWPKRPCIIPSKHVSRPNFQHSNHLTARTFFPYITSGAILPTQSSWPPTPLIPAPCLEILPISTDGQIHRASRQCMRTKMPCFNPSTLDKNTDLHSRAGHTNVSRTARWPKIPCIVPDKFAVLHSPSFGQNQPSRMSVPSIAPFQPCIVPSPPCIIPSKPCNVPSNPCITTQNAAQAVVKIALSEPETFIKTFFFKTI